MTMNDITELFCFVDDFCKQFQPLWKDKLKEFRQIQRHRESNLSLSEILTIILFFQQTPYTCFKHYYVWIQKNMNDCFPNLVSYSRFVRLKAKAFVPLYFLFLVTKGQCDGVSFIDATSLKVCKNQRIHRHKVFQGWAQRGKTSMGFFFGFKLHAIINTSGEIIDIYLSAGDVDDRKPVISMSKNLFGQIFGDRGYVSELIETCLKAFGISFFAKPKKNMKKSMNPIQKTLLKKRCLIETVFGEIKRRTSIEHSRHRSIWNFFTNILSSLVSYNIAPNKPKIGNFLMFAS